MSDIMLEQLFVTKTHIQPATWLNILIMLLYTPFGLILLTFRLILIIPIAILIILLDGYLPLWFLNIARPLMGFWCILNNYKPEFRKVPILACNHTTPFDVFPFLGHFNVSVLIDKGFFESSSLIKPFVKLLDGIPLERTQSTKETDRQNVITALGGKRQLLYFPEGWDTSGKVGLLVYQKFLFGLGKDVLPVAIKVRVPFLPIEPSLLGTSILREIFWIFFCPCYVFEVEFLEPTGKSEKESDIDFAGRVQKMTADVLGISTTNYSYKDALEYRKKLV
jgi:1-acyl-sn-glycerol-3-phosphate acyltransferase